MKSLPRSVACALAVSAAWAGLSATVFLAASAILPPPDAVAGLIVHSFTASAHAGRAGT